MNINPYTADGAEVGRWISDRQRLLRNEAEDLLRAEILNYEPRQQQWWNRDYSGLAAYDHSVEVNRIRWSQALGVPPLEDSPFAADLAPFYEDERIEVSWLTLDFLAGAGASGLRARALLALPKGAAAPPPLVIAQHGIGSSPERVFGLDDPQDIYKAYGRRLAEEGFAVLAPMNVTQAHPRARLTRLCSLLGCTLWGVEIARTRRLLDYLETREDIDMARVGMYGISLGGAYTMFTTPIEPRIGCAVVCAWFNHRRHKMAVDDPRYSCFLSVDEEHVWIPGWLREFTDSDLASLICPRPLFIEQGKADGIAWWPQVVEEYEQTAAHYERLGLGDRVELGLHEGGHEIRMEGSLEFLKKWLRP